MIATAMADPAPPTRARSRPASPLSLLAGSVLFEVLAAWLIVARHSRLGGLAVLAGALALLAGTAAARRARGGRERFAELVADRLFDTAVLAPLAWAWRGASPRLAGLALIGLGASYVASYERARGQSLGYRGVETLGYRAARVALLVVGLLSGWLAAMLLAFYVVTAGAAVVRAWNVVIQERRLRPAAGRTR
jgi:hypothetical protein